MKMMNARGLSACAFLAVGLLHSASHASPVDLLVNNAHCASNNRIKQPHH